jgi:hypothetical protein
MRANSRDPQPVRLANPTAESFVASLKVTHFFAIFFFWLSLIALLLHLAAYVAFQAGRFDEDLGLTGAPDKEIVVMGPPAPASATTTEPASAAAGTSWWAMDQGQYSRNPIVQIMATMRLVGLLSSMLLLVTLFIYLEISLLGRLAGVKNLTITFFLMLFFVATVYSWEPLLPGTRVLGSLFVFEDFVSAYIDHVQGGHALSWTDVVYYHARFLVLPLFSLALEVVAWLQFRRGYEQSVLMNE